MLIGTPLYTLKRGSEELNLYDVLGLPVPPDSSCQSTWLICQTGPSKFKRSCVNLWLYQKKTMGAEANTRVWFPPNLRLSYEVIFWEKKIFSFDKLALISPDSGASSKDE